MKQELQAFQCRMCGQCCQGEGGIIMSEKDQKRLANYLNISVETLLTQYTVRSNAKPCLSTGKDAYCIFFNAEKGCTVHPARPDICRAWPFFRGNIVDKESWAMIHDYCPGVNPQASHEQFALQGIAYLRKHGLTRKDTRHDPMHLFCRKICLQRI